MDNFKLDVFTAWNTKLSGESGKPKCILRTEINFVPTKDQHLIVKEGFGAERIEYILVDLISNSIEVHLCTMDVDNEYGANIPYRSQ